MQVKKIVAQWFFPIVLVCITGVIILRSYTPGTILSGWDTIHAEFNFPQYLSRILSVWQYHQGLGAPPSQAHVADLPRVLFLWLSSVFLPMEFLRYFYLFVMLLLGPLGVYFFILKRIFSTSPYRAPYSFVGALFYLLNFGTLQHFYTPLEMFVTMYGLLGWFFLVLEMVLSHFSKRNVILFALVTLFLAPAAHTATLWYVFFIQLVMYLVVKVVLHHFQPSLIKKSLVILTLLLTLNSYWILPNLYYVIQYSKDVQYSKTHRLYSNEFFLRSQKRGTITDLALLTNFPFDWSIYNFEKGSFTDQMGSWVKAAKEPWIKEWGFIVFGIMCLGAVVGIKRKNPILGGLIPIALSSAFFLINANPPFTTIFLFLREHIDLFREGFRFPFTKFSLSFIFVFSVYFAYGYAFILHHISRFFLRRTFILMGVILFAVNQIAFMAPAFTTGYVSPAVKVHIPTEYFELFSYMQNQPALRTLSLPFYTSNGWQYHNWGYQGAGFTWFGLKQPLLDREFDRWYWYNEESYRELSYAVYSKNSELFVNLLQKYNIGYILFDDSIKDPFSEKAQTPTFKQELYGLLYTSSSVSLEKRFGHLSVFKVNNRQKRTKFIGGSLPRVSPLVRWTDTDEAYSDLGDYISLNEGGDVNYPFRTFQNIDDKLNPALTFDFQNGYYASIFDIESSTEATLKVPSYVLSEKIVFANMYVRNFKGSSQVKFKFFLPAIIKEQEKIFTVTPIRSRDNVSLLIVLNGAEHTVPLLSVNSNWQFIDQVVLKTQEKNLLNNAPFSFEIETGDITIKSGRNAIIGEFPQLRLTFGPREIVAHPDKKDGWFTRIVKESEDIYALFHATDSIIGSGIDLGGLSHEFGYVIVVRSKSNRGLPLRVCMKNQYSQRCDLYDELSSNPVWHDDYFVLPPMKTGVGYYLEFTNVAYGTLVSENAVKSVSVIPFSHTFLKNLRIDLKDKDYATVGRITQQSVPVEYTRNWGFVKAVTVPTYNSVLPFSFVGDDAYEPLWQAYYFNKDVNWFDMVLPVVFGVPLDHVLVNNWANGWLLPKEAGIKSQISDARLQNQNSDLTSGIRDPKSIIIIFWPQYLQFLGFGLLITAFLGIIFWPARHR